MAKRKLNLKPLIVFIIFMIVLAATVFSLRKWQRNRLAYNARQSGLTAYQDHRWEVAANNLGKYIAIDPHDVKILLKYANTHLNIRPLKRNNVQQATTSYRAILRIDKNNLTAAKNLIGIFLKMNIAAEAELIAQQYLTTHKDPDIQTMLAIALAKQRKFKESSTKFHDIIKQSPNQIQAYEIMSQLAQKYPDHFPATAEYWLSLAVKNNPYSAQAFIIRASHFLKEQKTQEAIVDLEKAETFNLSDPDTHLRLSLEFARANMFKKSIAHLTNLQTQDPTNPLLWQTWARIVSQLNSKDQMFYVAQTGLKELDPDIWDFLPIATELFIKSGQFNQASNCLDKLNQKDFEPVTILFLQGLLAEAQKQHYKAILFWQQAQQSGDKSERTHLALARTYSHTKDLQSAAVQLRTLVSEQPYLFQAHLDLAKLSAKTGKWPEAAEQARLAKEIAPDNIEAILLLTQAQMKLIENIPTSLNDREFKNIERKLAELETATDGADSVKLLQLQLAMHRKQFTKAEQLLINLKANNKKNIKAEIIQINLLIAQNKLDQAISELTSIIKQFPNEVLPVNYLAVLLEQKGNRTDCEKTIKQAIERIKIPTAKRDLGLLLAGFYNYWHKSENAHQLLADLTKELPHDISIKRLLLNNDKIKKNIHAAQLIIDDIKKIEGEKGWQWRYEQANFWFQQENFKKYYPQIIVLLTENLQTNPADQLSRVLLATSYDKAGNFQLAVITYREALNRSPQDIRIIVPTVAIMYKAKEYELAEEILDRVARQKLFHPDISKLHVLTHLRKGRFKSAEIILEDLMNKDPNDHNIVLSLALLKMRQKKFTQSAKLLDLLQNKHPGSMVVTTALVELSIRQEDSQKALDICNKLLEQSPNASAYILRGNTYLSLGQNKSAKKDFDKAVSHEPDNVQAWISKSDFNRSIGDPHKATEDILTAIALAPDNFQIQKRAITLLLSSKNKDSTRHGQEMLRKALSSAPLDIELRLWKVQSLMMKKNIPAIEQAKGILQKITEEHPQNTNAWIIWGRMYLELDQRGKAMDTILHGLTYSPGDKNLLLSKARIEANTAPQLAIPALEQLNKNRPANAEIALELAKIYNQTEQTDKSIKLLLNLLNNCRKRDQRKVFIALAISLSKNGDQMQADHFFDSLYKSKPDDSQTFLAQTKLLSNGRKWNTLTEKTDQWSQNNPNDTDTLINIAEYLIANNEEKSLNIAENILRKIRKKKPECLKAMNSLAIFLQVTAQHEQAKQVYKQILEIEPDNLIAINNLAWIMCEQHKQYQNALELAQTGLRINPDYTDLIDTRGVIYYRLGDYHKAHQDFNKCIELYLNNSSSLPSTYFHLARLLVAVGKESQAIDRLQKSLNLSDNGHKLSPKENNEAQNLLIKLLKKKNHDYITYRKK